MKKILLLIATLVMACGILIGCNDSKRYYNSEVAPVGTINVVVSSGFTQEQIDLIVAAAEQIAAHVSNEVHNDFDVTVHVTYGQVPNAHVLGNGNVIVINPGEFFECPELYERLCHLQDDPDDSHCNPEYNWEEWKNRGHYISCMIAQARGRKDCPESY